MRELTKSDVNQISGGISATPIAVGAVVGAITGFLPAHGLISHTAGVLPITTFVTKGIPMILGTIYPVIIAGTCIGAAIGAAITYSMD